MLKESPELVSLKPLVTLPLAGGLRPGGGPINCREPDRLTPGVQGLVDLPAHSEAVPSKKNIQGPLPMPWGSSEFAEVSRREATTLTLPYE